MRLLFDQNLSPRLPEILAEVFPGSVHVRDVGLTAANNAEVWKYALTHGFTIISKDSDFHQLSFLHGHPPKVVWIRRGNCSTDEIALMLAGFSAQLIDFESDTTASYLAVS